MIDYIWNHYFSQAMPVLHSFFLIKLSNAFDKK